MAGDNDTEKLRRFFVEKINKPTTVLTGNEKKHLADVLRAKVGDKIILCPNDGKDYIFEISAFDKNSITLYYEEEFVNPTETNLFLTVFPALLKGDKTELVVQKLTELGVKRISPFISEFTVQKSEKNDRLKRTAHEVSKQCGRAIIPEIDDVMKFNDMINKLADYDAVVIAYEDAFTNGNRITDVVKGNERNVALIVGPEGGFSKKEVEEFINHGYKPVTLGKRILRAETASISATAVIMQLCGEWS